MTFRSTAAATAGAMVIITSMLLGGCAKYNGDKAAFCAKLPSAPSFSSLGQQIAGGTDAQATAKIDAAVEQFRSLERLAPRSIRPSVAALGDSAARIADKLRAPHGTIATWTASPDGNGRGTVERNPSNAGGSNDWTRQQILSNEFNAHRGLYQSISRLETYGVKTCGLDSTNTLFGLYQQYFPQENGPTGGPVGNNGTSTDQGNTSGNQPVIVAPDVAPAIPAPTTVP